MKIELDDDRMNRLVAMVVAAGKSPATDHNVMMAASEMLSWLQGQVNAAKAASAETAVAPKSNGHDEHVTH